MFDFGLSEILLIAIVAILFIGPKELPVVMAQVGRVFRRLNYMRHAVMMQFDEFMRESGMDDIRHDVNFEASAQKRSPADAHGDAVALIEKPTAVKALPKAGSNDGAQPKAAKPKAAKPKTASGKAKPKNKKASAKKIAPKTHSKKKTAVKKSKSKKATSE